MAKYTSLQQIQAELQEGEITCRQLVDYYLQQIEASKDLNAYVEVFAEEALAKAASLDARYQEDPGSVGRLFGMVIAIKDVLCYEGHQVTAGSKILEGFSSLFSGTAIERLLSEDAIIIDSTATPIETVFEQVLQAVKHKGLL